MTAVSGILSVSRLGFGFLGYCYGFTKADKIAEYVRIENRKKLAQLKEVGLDPESLRGQSFHMPNIHDPWFSEEQIEIRERIPNYYLSPGDEYAYQLKKKREKLAYLFQQRAVAARAVAKERQKGFHSYYVEEVADVKPEAPQHHLLWRRRTLKRARV
eukprot:593500_1